MRSRQLVGRRITYIEAIAEAAATLDDAGFRYSTGEVDERSGVILAYTPPARANAIQSLLYREAWSRGVAPIPVRDTAGLREVPWPGPMLCHWHWIGEVLKDATEADADRRVADFADRLAALKSDGRKLVWTLHNFLPHDTAMPERDLELRKILIEHTDAIHTMTKGTVELARSVFSLPEEKVFYAPHPSYAGAYPDVVSREDARGELGIGPEDYVFVLFGAIARYKGVQDLMASFERLTAGEAPRPARLIIAGAPSDPLLESEIRAWGFGREDVVIELGRIAADDVQYYFRAADAAVLPYREMLNSGSAMLALTFGLPIVVPRIGGFVELVTEYAGTSYDPEDRDGLEWAMQETMNLDPGRARRRIETRIDAVSPAQVSGRFFDGLFETIGWPTRSPGRADAVTA